MCHDGRNGHFFQILRDLLDLEREHTRKLIWRFSSFSRFELWHFGHGYRKRSSFEKFRELMDCSDFEHFDAWQLLNSFDFDYSETTADLFFIFQEDPYRISRNKIYEIA